MIEPLFPFTCQLASFAWGFAFYCDPLTLTPCPVGVLIMALPRADCKPLLDTDYKQPVAQSSTKGVICGRFSGAICVSMTICRLAQAPPDICRITKFPHVYLKVRADTAVPAITRVKKSGDLHCMRLETKSGCKC